MGVIVKIVAPFNNVPLPPNELSFQTNEQTTLTDAEYAALNAGTLRAISVVQSGVSDPVRTSGGDSGGGSGAVDSVNGHTGAVVLAASDVGAATAAQGAKADSAVQPGSLATVATSGAYGDLTGAPDLSALTAIVPSNGTPGPSDGADGDCALDYTTGLLFGPKASGAWPSVPKIAPNALLHQEYLKPSGSLAETYPRHTYGGNGCTVNNAQLRLDALVLPAGVSVGHLARVSVAAAVTPTHWWMALFDSSLAMLAVTADQTSTAFAANTYYSLPIATTAAGSATSFTTTYTGAYYLGFLMLAGTMPTLNGTAVGASAILSLSPVLAGLCSNSGLTGPPSFPFTAVIGGSPYNLAWGAACS